jgi:hypothetical protein
VACLALPCLVLPWLGSSLRVHMYIARKVYSTLLSNTVAHAKFV